jgi:serine/threonine protein kinase
MLEQVARAFCSENGHSFVAPVGAGAFKETFHIILATGEPQALKVYQPGFSPERTSRELAAMQRCSHTNIGRLTSIALFFHDGIQHLLSVEEFLPGGTLTSRLQRGLLNRPELQGIGTQLVSAVAHIASHDLVHRDIKPDNILFRANGDQPVIVDFGLVRDLVDTSLTQSWLMRGPGTPLFAAPEQLRNEKSMIDWRSDQFSLGVVLSLGAFGFHPYEDAGMSPAQVVERVAERNPSAPRFVQASTEFKMPFLMKMTAPWPVERFRTPGDLQIAWREANS